MRVRLPVPHSVAVREPHPAHAANDGRERTVAARPQESLPPARERRLSPRLRTALVAAHVLVGVGWFGIVVAKLVLEIVAVRTNAREVVQAGYQFMAALDRAAFPPAAVATLMTGIVLSVGTPWGLFRYWWIVVKLVLTVVVVVTGVAFVGAWTEQARTAASADTGAAMRWLIGMGLAHVLALGTATVISVLKPWGRIRSQHPTVTVRPSVTRKDSLAHAHQSPGHREHIAIFSQPPLDDRYWTATGRRT